MTAAKNRGGLYLRARAAVTNPQTPGQTLIRTMLAAVSTTWRTLTEEQRQGWYDWAAVNPITNVFGDPLLMTGSQAYIALNTPRLQAGLDQVDDAPVGFGQPISPYIKVGDAATLVITGAAVDLLIPLQTPEIEEGELLTYVSKPQSQSTRFFKGPYQLLGVTSKTGGPGSTNVELDETVLPPVAAGQVVFFRVRMTTDTGRLSTPFFGSVIVTEAP